MPTVRQDAAPFRQEDLVSIEKTLYTPKENELVARKIARPNFNHPPYASEIGYDWYDRAGSAKLLAAGANANDVPFVTEKMGRVTMPVRDLVIGIKYTKSERLAVQARQALGRGPAVGLDMLRVEAARRFIGEGEDKLFFVGNADFKIPGLINKEGIISEDVAQGAASGSAAFKRKWANKTAKEKLADLRNGRAKHQAGGYFKSKLMICTAEAKMQLEEPYSDQSPMTVLQWMQTQGMYIEDIVETQYMSAAYNGLGVDCFALVDNSPEFMELMIAQEMELGEPVYNLLGTSEQAVIERIAGGAFRHASAIYLGKGI